MITTQVASRILQLMIDNHAFNSPLASHTQITRALALSDQPDRFAAACAGFAFAVVDAQVLFEIAGFAVAAAEVAQGGAALFDRCGEYGFDCLGELFKTCGGDAAGGTAWVDAGEE